MDADFWGDGPRETAIHAEKLRREVGPPSSSTPPENDSKRSGWLKALFILEAVACVLALLAGVFLLEFAEIFTAAWVPALAVALLILGPLNLGLTPLIRGMDRSTEPGWLRPALITVKVLISTMLIPLLLLGLFLVAAVFVLIYALTHASGW